MDHIFPMEIIDRSFEMHFSKNYVRGRNIYFLTMMILIAGLASLPFIRIDITCAASGILKTAEEPGKIVISSGGIVESNNLLKNSHIEKGDTLIIFDYHAISSEIDKNMIQIRMIDQYIQDLSYLVEGSLNNVITARYLGVAEEYNHQMTLLKSNIGYVEETHLTNRKLYDEGFISRVKYESGRRQYFSEKETMELEKDKYRNQFKNEIEQYRQKRSDLVVRNRYLYAQIKRHIVTATVSGALADYADIHCGSYLAEGQVIGRIIPNKELIATFVIPTDKIARIHIGQKIKLAIDSYPAISYGYVMAEVASIQKDVSVFADQPGFPVSCKIKMNPFDNQIKLKSGMTFTGMFILSRKSLLKVILEKGESLFTRI